MLHARKCIGDHSHKTQVKARTKGFCESPAQFRGCEHV